MRLPYRVETRTGDCFDIDFPLHPATDDPVRTTQILSAVLEAIDRDIDIVGPAGNGDVLQAVAMALAVRATMIHAPVDTTAGLARDLLQTALTAAGEAPRHSSPAGHA